MADLQKVAEVAKNATTKIVLSTTEYKGTMYVDVREYVESETYTGFTKKGIRLHSGKLDALIAGLQAVKAALPKQSPPKPAAGAEESAGPEA